MTTIKLKNGSGAPTAGDLAQGEPALDLTNKRLYTEDSGGTVIEVGTNPTSVTTGDITATGTATFAGLTTTADVSFGDNDKAIFGAGSDLQIYHDGSHSFIKDTGVGDLYIFASDALKLVSATGEGMATFNANGDVSLRYDNATKLATTSTGIDVTGTVVSDGLSIGGTSNFTGLVRLTGDRGTFVDSSENSTVPHIFATNDAVGDFSQEAGHLVIQSRVHTSVYRDIIFAGGTTNAKKLMRIQGEGDISFYEDTGTTAKLFWDASAESLGIGTSSPSFPLEVDGGTGDGIKIKAGNTSNDDSFLVANSSNTTMFLVDGGGNVGIGTSSPGQALAVESSSVGVTRVGITNTGNAAAGAGVQFITKNGATQVSNATLRTDNAGNFSIFSGTTTEAERMRIDSSGNLLVGTTSSAGKMTVYADSGVGQRIQVFQIAPTVMEFRNSQNSGGSITIASGGGTSYNTSSDQRLKDNIVDAPSASDDIDAIQVRSFDWKADGSHQKYGMVAQELQSVAPEAVSGDADSDDMMGVDYSKLVPMLIKEIQSLRARVAQLEGEN